MLEGFVRILYAIIMTMTGYYILCKITMNNYKKITFKTVALLLILIILSVINYKTKYTIFYSLSIFLVNIAIYKSIFQISIEQSITSVCIFMIILFFSDMVCASIVRLFFSIEKIRNSLIISLATNVVVSGECIILIKNKKILTQIRKYYKEISNNKRLINLTFLILLVVDFCVLAYNLTHLKIYNINYLINSIGMIIFGIITYIFIENKNNYNKLSNEYDTLFNYVQNFEEWIEKEQLNRHEYKNQLAVLRCLTKEKKVKNKIDEILEDNINIEGQAVTNFKSLPKGGIKGLMYYKAAIAQKQKINLTTDLSIENKGILSKLSEKEIRILCKLIGIYFDNAIEASAESSKENLTVEIYELKDKVNFVFSNTFKKHKSMKDRNKKGVSSKGEGRGNGLYFASKLIKANDWIEERQEIIDNYYIQELSVLKKQKK